MLATDCGRWGKLLASALLLSLLAGCETLGYYHQAAMGQWQIYRQRLELQSLIDHPDTDPPLRQRLQLAQQLRQFAVTQLQLPDTESYRHYVDLERPYVVWNVVAAPELSLAPYQWCYPWLGCLEYRGYFDKDKAHAKAKALADEGWDVMVGGVQAYSTLGWFADPLLNTFTLGSEIQLAAILFHEMAHQQLYIKDDTAFNESFASTLEQIGVERWFQWQQQPDAYASYQWQQDHKSAFITLLLQFRHRLQQLYASEEPPAVKRQRKAALIKELRETTYPDFRAHWQDSATFDGWMASEINNARLALIAQYHTWKPAFRQLLQQHQNDLGAFYRAAKTLSELPRAERQQVLQALMPEEASAVAVD